MKNREPEEFIRVANLVLEKIDVVRLRETIKRQEHRSEESIAAILFEALEESGILT